MNSARNRWALVLGLVYLPMAGASLPAAEPARTDPARVEAALPRSADIETLTVQPASVRFKGSDSAAQLIVTATVAGRQVDLTGALKYAVTNPRVASITASGRVVPRTNGETAIKAIYGDRELTISVKAEGLDDNEPINFANTLVPIFSKLGCNAGGCHGKLSGQNGFRLSLLGADPELDYMTLVRENRGRRVAPSAPDHSLLLLKSAGGMAHGGGKRMDRDSDEYKVMRRWIASGTPFGEPTDPVVTRITVFPEHRVLARHSKQQIAIYAHYSDDHVEDVTRRVQYDSNDQEIAVVEPTGLVRTLNLSGEAAIMARYQGKVIVFRATVPLGVAVPKYAWQPQTIVDQFTRKKWEQLGIVPSGLCGDEQFVRRVYLDVCGTLPTPEQVRAFLADQAPNKRDSLIDQLVDSAEYSYFFANKWADVLRVKRGNNQQQGRAFGTFAFHEWIRDSVQNDKPYDQFVRHILALSATRRAAPRSCGTRTCSRRTSSSITLPSCSSARACSAPSAITTPMSAGARTTTGAWRPTLAGWPARMCRSSASAIKTRTRSGW